MRVKRGNSCTCCFHHIRGYLENTYTGNTGNGNLIVNTTTIKASTCDGITSSSIEKASAGRDTLVNGRYRKNNTS